jgi:hypothetical protein
MPITFKSKHSPDILMLETVALELIKLMGHSGTVPGALATQDIPEALAHLKRAVASAPDRALEADRDDGKEGEEREPPVSVAQRATPLIETLEAAIINDDYVIWDR